MERPEYNTGGPGRSTPPQPGLRPFIIYDTLPDGMATHFVTDGRNEPMLRSGEVLVIDPSDCDPMHGELFAVQWKSGKLPSVELTTWLDRKDCWAIGGIQPAFVAERAGATAIPACYVGDYGYRTEYMREVILGRVIGILEPSFSEPLRIGGLN